jgi:hypothetical protein
MPQASGRRPSVAPTPSGAQRRSKLERSNLSKLAFSSSIQPPPAPRPCRWRHPMRLLAGPFRINASTLGTARFRFQDSAKLSCCTCMQHQTATASVLVLIEPDSDFFQKTRHLLAYAPQTRAPQSAPARPAPPAPPAPVIMSSFGKNSSSCSALDSMRDVTEGLPADVKAKAPPTGVVVVRLPFEQPRGRLRTRPGFPRTRR